MNLRIKATSIFLKYSGLILLVLCVTPGCHSPTPPQVVNTPEVASVSAMDDQAIDDLKEGWREMVGAYGDALHSGTVRLDGEIPPCFWSKPIRALNPIRIYYDVSNTVIVQAITNGFEYGKYISPGTSSHAAQGDFYLTRTRGTVSDYRKRITFDVFWYQNEHYFKPVLR